MATQNIYDMVDTWNDAGTTFTAIKMDVTDTNSDAASLLLDLQVGSTSKFSLKKNGKLTLTSISASIPTLSFSSSDVHGIGHFLTGYDRIFFMLANTSQMGSFRQADAFGNAAGFTVQAAGGFGWLDDQITSVVEPDLLLMRDAANTLALRNGTNAQTFNIYNTRTDASNYERGGFKWTGNVLEIFSEAAGTGTQRNIQLNGANRAAKINDPTGGTTEDTEARAAINDIIDALESHGISAAA